MKPIEYLHFDIVDSTNTWVKEHIDTLNPDGITCVCAKQQTSGRGRLGRTWISPPGENIYATLYFTLPLGVSYIGNLGQILSLGCVESLEQEGLSPQIKWPNDILIAHKKLAGILCETIPLYNKIGIALGIGINVDVAPSGLDQPTISLSQLRQKPWQSQQLLESIIERFLTHLETLHTQGFAPFLKSYTQRLTSKKALVHTDGVRTLKGKYETINEKGQLILRLENGERVALFSGEVRDND
jgi:BirA family biotin operon repressor/biotin-[acetyl-CoA-carboxylase] ligase